MAIRLDQLERQWFAERYPGATAQTPLAHMQRYFYIKELGGSSAQRPLNELEREWLRRFCANYGLTVPSGKYASELWTYAAAAIGQAPSKYVRENKRLVYSVLPPQFSISKNETITVSEGQTIGPVSDPQVNKTESVTLTDTPAVGTPA